ncbi:MAG: Ig-like domain-containing protein [Phototrophicaceae bacterium]
MIYSSKRFVMVLVLLFTLIIIGVVLSQTLFNPFGSTCPPLIETALNELDQCGRIGINTTCYGYNRVEATFNQPVPLDYFTQQGDTAHINEIDTLHTAPYDQFNNEWGVALMRVQADIPNTLPGQGVVFVLMGDTTVENAVESANVFEPSTILSATTALEVALRSGPGLDRNVIYTVPLNTSLTLDAINPTGDWVRAIYQDVTSADPKAVDGQFGWIPISSLSVPLAPNSLSVLEDTPHTPMQAFYFETGIGNAACKEAPNTLVVQGPENLTVALDVNGMNVSLSSMLALQAPANGETRFICVVGPCTLQVDNEPEQILETFEQVFCPHQSNAEVGVDEGIGNNVVESCNPKEPIDPQDVIELIVLDEIYANVPELLNYDPEVVKNTAEQLNLDVEGLLNLIEIIREQTPQATSTVALSGGFILPTVPTIALTPTPFTPTPDTTLTPVFPTQQPTVEGVPVVEATATPNAVAPVANDDSGSIAIGTHSARNVLSNDSGNPAPIVISFGGPNPANVTDVVANGDDVYSSNGIDVAISSDGTAYVDPTYATGNGTLTFYYRIQNSLGTDDGQITLAYGSNPATVPDTYSTNEGTELNISRRFLPSPQTVVEVPSRLLSRPFSGMTIGGPMNLLFNDTLGSPVATLFSFGGLSLGGTEASHASGSNVSFTAVGSTAMLTVNADGSFSLTNPPFNTGTWQFNYKLKNAINSSIGTVTFEIYREVDAVDDGNNTTGFYVVPIGGTVTSANNILANDIIGIPEGSLDSYGYPSSAVPGADYTVPAGGGLVTVNLASNGTLNSLEADLLATPGVYPFSYTIANSHSGDYADVYVEVIEETNPSVANITPYNGATAISATTNITLVFSEDVNLNNFSLDCNGVIFNKLNSALSGNGTSTITIDPNGTLPYGQSCNLTIELNDVTDVDTFDPPNELLNRYASSFTTHAQPIITAITPANNSNIGTTDTFMVTFDQTVTFNPSVVTVTCDGTPQTFTPATTQTGINSFTFPPATSWTVGVCTFSIPATAFLTPSAGASSYSYTLNVS